MNSGSITTGRHECLCRSKGKEELRTWPATPRGTHRLPPSPRMPPPTRPLCLIILTFTPATPSDLLAAEIQLVCARDVVIPSSWWRWSWSTDWAGCFLYFPWTDRQTSMKYDHSCTTYHGQVYVLYTCTVHYNTHICSGLRSTVSLFTSEQFVLITLFLSNQDIPTLICSSLEPFIFMYVFTFFTLSEYHRTIESSSKC